MNTLWKNILLVVVLVALSSGIVYLGLKIAWINKPGTTATPTSTTTPTLNRSKDIKLEKFETSCASNDECTIVAFSKRNDKGEQVEVTGCHNKTILASCTDCRTSEALVAEVEKEAACTCVNDLCQLELKSY